MRHQFAFSGARAEPHVREAGDGPGVVCIHCNASSATQWGGLMALLAPRYRVLAPDLWGAGRSPAWHGRRPRRLDDEVDLLEPVLERAGSRAVIVGHSYGAAVALRVAQRMPTRVRALALYEPTLFSPLDQERPPPNEADGIRLAVELAARAVDRGELQEAARHFIDYWTGPGAWDAMPPARQEPIASSMRDVRHWAGALFEGATTAAGFASLKVPVLYMTGGKSPASARGVARILTSVLPDVRLHDFPQLGHMGPLEDPGRVNRVVEGFLAGLEVAEVSPQFFNP